MHPVCLLIFKVREYIRRVVRWFLGLFKKRRVKDDSIIPFYDRFSDYAKRRMDL